MLAIFGLPPVSDGSSAKSTWTEATSSANATSAHAMRPIHSERRFTIRLIAELRSAGRPKSTCLPRMRPFVAFAGRMDIDGEVDLKVSDSVPTLSPGVNQRLHENVRGAWAPVHPEVV